MLYFFVVIHVRFQGSSTIGAEAKASVEKNLVVGTKKFPNLGLTASVHLYHIFHWMSLDFATKYLLAMTVWRPWKAR